MKRRTAIRNVIFLSAGAALLPSCVQGDEKASIVLKSIPITGKQEKLLAELSEFILPTTSTPGAKQLASQHFVLMMVDDCFKKEDQEKFVKGMQSFDDYADKTIGSSFVKADKEKRTTLLKAIEAEKDVPEEILTFYNAS